MQKDGKNYKPVEVFFDLFALCPPGREPWSGNPDEPLAGLSLFDVSVANVISDNIVAKGAKLYPITLKTDQGARYAMAASVAPARIDVQVMRSDEVNMEVEPPITSFDLTANKKKKNYSKSKMIF